MFRFVLFALCATAAEFLTLQPVPGMSMVESVYPRRGTVNLDDPPKERWVNVIRQHREEIIPYLQHWQRTLDRRTEIDQPAWMQAVQAASEQDHLDEMAGILHALDHGGVTWSSLLLFQAIYELGSPLACSEVVAAAEDGTVVHGRNLDYAVISPVIEISFTRNGTLLFVAPTYLAQIGVHTALKPKHWSFGQNTRRVSGDTVASSLKRLQGGAKVFQNFARSVMEQDLPYSQAVRQLQGVPLMRDQYFVVAGAGAYEGVVIARAADPGFVKTQELSAETHDWFLFQTNDDWDGPPKDGRREAGLASLGGLSQDEVSPSAILDLMMRPPVYALSNVVLFMMAPRSGQFCSVLSWQNHDDTSISRQCEMTGWRS